MHMLGDGVQPHLPGLVRKLEVWGGERRLVRWAETAHKETS